MEGLSSRELRVIACRVAGEAAGYLRDLREDYSVFKKVSSGKETIVADKKAEDYIVDLLKNEGFRGIIVTEESGVVEVGGERLIAIIDPLDGSFNYACGIPWCSVSIGFARCRRGFLNDVVAGAVQPIYYPHASYSFSSVEGVFVGGEKVSRDDVERNLELIGYNTIALYCESSVALKSVEKILRAKNYSFRVRSLGCASLEIIATSLGKMILFIDARSKLRCVDVAVALGISRLLNASFSSINGDEVKARIDFIDKIDSLILSPKKEYLNWALNVLGSKE